MGILLIEVKIAPSSASTITSSILSHGVMISLTLDSVNFPPNPLLLL